MAKIKSTVTTYEIVPAELVGSQPVIAIVEQYHEAKTFTVKLGPPMLHGSKEKILTTIKALAELVEGL